MKQIPNERRYTLKRLLTRVKDGVYVTGITSPPKGFRGSPEGWKQAVTWARNFGLLRTYRRNRDGLRLVEPSAKGFEWLAK